MTPTEVKLQERLAIKNLINFRSQLTSCINMNIFFSDVSPRTLLVEIPLIQTVSN